MPDYHNADIRSKVLNLGPFIVAPQPFHPRDFAFGLVIPPHRRQVSAAETPPAIRAFGIKDFLVGEIVLAIATIRAYNEYFVLDVS
jgi:hypothetical protein